MNAWYQSDVIAFICAVLLVALMLLLGTAVFRFFKKRRGVTKFTALGATDLFYSKDQKKAAEVIVNQEAGKKQEEQTSGDPEVKRKNNPNDI